MIRWRFVLSRLIIVGVILFLLTRALGPAVDYAARRAIESTVGARVDIGQTTVGLFPPRIQFREVAVADPREDKSLKNLAEAAEVELVIDGRELLQRRWVAKTAEIHGLEIGSDRIDSGHFETDPVEVDDVESTGDSFLTRWIAGAAGAVGDRASEIGGDFETVKRGQQIRQQWQTKYDELLAAAKDLESRLRDIRDRNRDIENPLRDWESFQRTMADVKTARQQWADIRRRLDQLPVELQSDYDSMGDAHRLDLEKIDAYVPGDLAGAESIGIDLVTDAIAEQIRVVRGYIESGKDIADITVMAPESQDRHRGRDVVLDRFEHPEFMVRQCSLDGFFSASGKRYRMTGLIDRLASSESLLREPTRARLRLQAEPTLTRGNAAATASADPEVVRVDYVRDRRGSEPIDLVTLHWPSVQAQDFRLGKGDKATIAVDGGRRELWIRMQVRGDEIDGRLVSKQTGVNLRLDVDGDLSGTAAVASLSDSLRAIDRVEVDATFAGTWRSMDVDVQSNLGRSLELAARQAMRKQIDATRAELSQRLAKVQAEETAKLQRWISEHQAGATALLAKTDATIEEMSRNVIDQMGDADAYLGRLNTGLRDLMR